ncbi:mitochondrial ribosomal protein subunit L23 [Diaporthe helianthi]|uniref:Large ribosomal subunit protein uL23m n=1 Tax=Diaporthe helianthi TaxID=158607 RepID=A0A2P5IFK7_DIAHE|nr:mitochondrial ribosomal protein subunit L23 [Diaporthe helianthi]
MSSTAAVGAAEALARRAPFRLGEKAVFLPNHVVAFVRPKEGQPPTMATFNVPLSFNKLDFRDYLWNVYNVEVRSVRSFVNQMRPRQKQYGNSRGGKWYRPRSQKMMIAELARPFVWPEAPEDLTPWDKLMFDTVEGEHLKGMEKQYRSAKGMPLLRDQMEKSVERGMLRTAAERLLSGRSKWKPGQPLGALWVEVDDADEARGFETAVSPGGEDVQRPSP